MLEIKTEEILLQTRGFTDIVDITPQVAALLKKNEFSEGQVTIMVPGSTGGITTIEYEPGLKKDLPEFFDSIIPQDRSYHHDQTWQDGNGYAHLRSALLKPSLTVPFMTNSLLLGTWQQIVFVDFDNRKRNRRLIVQFIGVKKAG
jgi:secondary thiamine-phosphate synthase enzyme